MSKSVTTTETESDSIVLKKGANGKFAYEVKCYGETIDEIMKKIDLAHEKLEKKYGE